MTASQRDPRLAAAAEKAAAFNSTFVGRLNGYRCEQNPAHKIITIDREAGVTPYTTSCVHCERLGHPNQRGGFYRWATMRSAMYRIPQDLTPTHEWYRPDSLEGLDRGMVDHLLKGGLTLREIAAKTPARTDDLRLREAAVRQRRKAERQAKGMTSTKQ